MKWNNMPLKIRLYVISAIILLVGLSSAVVIYLTAMDDSDNVLGYEVVDGVVYPITPQNSKMYVHDLELYGGKAAVLADEFKRWFIDLWHGKSLAFTIAFISTILCIGVSFVAYHTPAVPKPHARGDDSQA